MNIILSTAGHIDHGKTYLIEKLTGKNTMHHKEELERKMTIDLGYSNITIDDMNVSIIDVPGHKDYLKNTICGIINSNICVLIISAIDGVCVQTKEHFDIINMSFFYNLIIYITKLDLADDIQIENTKAEINELIKNSNIHNIKILELNYDNSLDELKKNIYAFSKDIKIHNIIPHIKVDNSFSVNGYGTVVSGDLISGIFKNNQEVTIYPQKNKSRIKNIQTHSKKVENLACYSRIAINLANIEKKAIFRGNVISTIPNLNTTKVIDVIIYKNKHIKNYQDIKLFTGTSHIMAKLVIISDINEKLCLSQLRLKSEILCFAKDKVILLDMNNNILSGGLIINPYSKKYSKISDIEKKLLVDSKINDIEYFSILSVIISNKFIYMDYCINFLGINIEKMENILYFLKQNKYIITFKKRDTIYILQNNFFNNLLNSIDKIIHDYKHEYSLRNSMSKNIIYGKFLSIDKNIIDFTINNTHYKYDEIRVFFENKNCILDDERYIFLHNELENSKGIVSVKKITKNEKFLKEMLYNNLSEHFIKLNDEYILSMKNFNTYKKFLNLFFENNEKLSIADFKNKFNLSRNDTVIILEYFDNQKFTKRFENYRIKLYNSSSNH